MQAVSSATSCMWLQVKAKKEKARAVRFRGLEGGKQQKTHRPLIPESLISEIWAPSILSTMVAFWNERTINECCGSVLCVLSEKISSGSEGSSAEANCCTGRPYRRHFSEERPCRPVSCGKSEEKK